MAVIRPRGHRCAASVPPFTAPGGAVIRRASFYQSKTLLLHDFLQTAELGGGLLDMTSRR